MALAGLYNNMEAVLQPHNATCKELCCKPLQSCSKPHVRLTWATLQDHDIQHNTAHMLPDAQKVREIQGFHNQAEPVPDPARTMHNAQC
jgi:hypothetical protein